MATFTWFGHAACRFDLADKAVWVDPMLQNPNSPIKALDVDRADLVYVTHDHPDHLGDAYEICKRTSATFAAVYEVAEQAEQNGVKNVARLNVGGSLSLDGVKLTVTPAVHSALHGTPTGIILQGDGLTIYYAGDTALFGDMSLLRQRYSIDLALLPIGGNYTMDVDAAASAVDLLKPKMVFAIHYGTFPPLANNQEEFVRKVGSYNPEVKVLSLKPGEVYTLTARQMHIAA